MKNLSESEKHYLKGYAQALQDWILELTGDNTCHKRYDPIDFEEGFILSYAFDMKDGGRRHPLSDYKDLDDICDTLLNETIQYVKTN